MFVRKDTNGNLVGVGSIDHGRLAQLQEAEKRKTAKADAESKAESKAEPKAAEPKAAEPKPVEKEAAPDASKTTKSSATPTPTKLP